MCADCGDYVGPGVCGTVWMGQGGSVCQGVPHCGPCLHVACGKWLLFEYNQSTYRGSACEWISGRKEMLCNTANYGCKDAEGMIQDFEKLILTVLVDATAYYANQLSDV
jgi:hypothetical protein